MKFACDRFPTSMEDAGRFPRAAGASPLWARDGRELFFLYGDNNLMSVAVPRIEAFTPGNPTKILGTLAARYFIAGPGRTYDVSRDGQQFLMIRTGVTADLTPPRHHRISSLSQTGWKR